MSAAGVDCVLEAGAQVGEGATWCALTQRLLWVDAWAKSVHRLDPVSGVDEHWTLPQRVGCVAPCTDGRLLLGLEDGFWLLDPASGAAAPVAALAHAGDNRCNDSVVDPAGRMWCGSMNMKGVNGPLTGELFDFDGRSAPRRHFGDIGIANGLACAPNGRSLYLSDSHPSVNRIWRFALDPESGELGNRTLFLDGAELPGRPDGATVDSDGCYWICAMDGWSVLRITPQGKIDRRIVLPVSKPSKLAIGGARLDTLFITSISATLDAAGRAAQAQAGHLFAVHVGPLGIASPTVSMADLAL